VLRAPVSPVFGRGTQTLVIRSLEDPVADEQTTPPAERPRTDETELARGRVEQTPFSIINWVALAIGAVVALALVVVVVAYVVA
jgi:hypothetical protein